MEIMGVKLLTLLSGIRSHEDKKREVICNISLEIANFISQINLCVYIKYSDSQTQIIQ